MTELGGTICGAGAWLTAMFFLLVSLKGHRATIRLGSRIHHNE